MLVSVIFLDSASYSLLDVQNFTRVHFSIPGNVSGPLCWRYIGVFGVLSGAAVCLFQ